MIVVTAITVVVHHSSFLSSRAVKNFGWGFILMAVVMMLMNLCLEQESISTVHTDLQPATCQHTSALYYVVNLGAQEAQKKLLYILHVLKLLYELATPAETI